MDTSFCPTLDKWIWTTTKELTLDSRPHPYLSKSLHQHYVVKSHRREQVKRSFFVVVETGRLELRKSSGLIFVSLVGRREMWVVLGASMVVLARVYI